MNFIALIIALLLERVLGEHAKLREPEWYRRYAAWLRGLIGSQPFFSGPVGLVILVGGPTALTAFIYVLLGGALLSLLALVFSVTVLVFCIGPRDLDAEASAYIAAVEAGDEAKAAALAQSLTGTGDPGVGATRDRRVAEGLLGQFNERLFGVLFWFVLMGPLGAVLYRLSALAKREGLGVEDRVFAAAAVRLHGILDWFPARLIALGFALAGSFEEAVTDWKAYRDRRAAEFWQVNDDIIVATGRGALRMQDGDDSDEPGHAIGSIRAALGLVLRTLILWVVLFGMITIAGFAF